MTASPGVTYTNDAVGNRTGKSGGVSYTWDDVNRMTSLTASSTTWNYRYRADGMRVSKKRGSGGDLDTDYRYDGQMLIEEFFSGTSYPRDYVQVIRYGLGARGIDFIERVRQQSGTVQGYPIYDGHGNMVATLSKNGNGFLVSDRRSYDAWGNVRKGNTMGEPNGRYCANLGHVQDDESGLVYMRARYYEPWTGRFVSEDPAGSGSNWYLYCGNDPISRADHTGRNWTNILGGALGAIGMGYALAAILTMYGENPLMMFTSAAYRCELATTSALIATMFFAASAICLQFEETAIPVRLLGVIALAAQIYRATIAGMCLGLDKARYCNSSAAVNAAFAYGLILIGFVVAIAVKDML